MFKFPYIEVTGNNYKMEFFIKSIKYTHESILVST